MAISDDEKTVSDRDPAGYQAYLLRCWQEGDGWRYSLEAIGGDRRRGFTALTGLLAALEAELAALVEPDAGD